MSEITVFGILAPNLSRNPFLPDNMKYPRVRNRPAAAATFLLAPVATFLMGSAVMAGNTWDGGGGNDNWTTNANWNLDTLPTYTNPLTFAGTTRLTPNNNSATASVAGITFSSGAGAFTLGGSSVTLGGNITNGSTNTQTINLPLVLDANRQIQTNSGGIVLGGPISGAFNLIQSGTGGLLTLNSAGSSFSRLQINSGTTRLGVNDALPTGGGVTFSTAAGSGTLDINGKTQTLGAQITIGGTGGAGTVTISDTAGGGVLKLGGNVVQNTGTTNTVAVSAELDLNGATRTFLLNNSSATVTVSSVIVNSTGTAGLAKSGTGTLILSAANTYNGGTVVNAGTLLLNGSTTTGTLSVAASGTLGGIGSVGGAATVNGILSPGQSPGTLTFLNTLGLLGSTIMEIDGTNGAGVAGGHDSVNLTGSGASGVISFGGAMTLDIGVTFGVGSYSWDLFNFASETGTFAGITLSDQYSGALVDPDLDGVWSFTGVNDTWTFTESTGVLGLTVVPEPASVLLGIGGLGVLLVRRRRAN